MKHLTKFPKLLLQEVKVNNYKKSDTIDQLNVQWKYETILQIGLFHLSEKFRGSINILINDNNINKYFYTLNSTDKDNFF